MQSLCRYNHSIFVNCTILHTQPAIFSSILLNCGMLLYYSTSGFFFFSVLLFWFSFYRVFSLVFFYVTSFVILFSRTQPLHFETVWLSRNWEIYDLWKRYLYVNRNNDNYVIYKCYTNKLSRWSRRVTAWLCVCEDFPSCCLQVYLIRGWSHISFFLYFVFIKVSIA